MCITARKAVVNQVAEKDITEKILEAYNDVFADIVNVLLFNGKEVIKPDEQVKMFKSDFGIVADYFVQMRKNRDYKPEPRKFNHVQAVLQILSVMTGDHRYEEAIGNKAEGDPTDMCEVLDRVEMKGVKIGEEKATDKILKLMQKLFAVGRTEDAEKAANDKVYCAKLLKEFGLV